MAGQDSYEVTTDASPALTDHALGVKNPGASWEFVNVLWSDMRDLIQGALNNVNITGGSISGITDLAVADGGTGASTAAGARTNLGLGSIATQAASNVSITGGSISGITDLAIADGGTGASDAGTARSNLGLGSIATQDASNVSITGGSITGLGTFEMLSTASGSFGGTLDLYHNSPSPAGGDDMWRIRAYGEDSASNKELYAQITFHIDSASSGAEQGQIDFDTNKTGSTALRMYLRDGLVVGNPSGNDKGFGSINAQNIYDDDSLLCAPIEEALSGNYDREVWEELAPKGGVWVHEDMKAKGLNPNSADSYVAMMEQESGLPGYWNRTSWPDRGRPSLAERHERVLLAMDYASLALRDNTLRTQVLEAEVADLASRLTALEAAT